MLKGMWMMHAEQQQCILYTANDGPLPVHSVHLYCEGTVTPKTVPMFGSSIVHIKWCV